MLLTVLLSIIDKLQKRENFSGSNTSGFSLFIMIIMVMLGITTLISSCILAYKCNQHENSLIKLLIVLFVFFFTEFYIPYYLIKYGILGRKCKNNVIVNSNNNIRRNNKRR